MFLSPVSAGLRHLLLYTAIGKEIGLELLQKIFQQVVRLMNEYECYICERDVIAQTAYTLIVFCL